MRKGLLYLLSACMLTAAFPSCAIAGSEHIKIIVDGTEIAQKHTPVVINGRTLVAADSVFGLEQQFYGTKKQKELMFIMKATNLR